MAEAVVDPKEGEKPEVEEVEEPEEGESEGESGPKDGDLKAALHAERGKRKALAIKLKAAEQSVGELKPLADEYKVLLPHLPALLAGAKGDKKAPASTEPDPELVELANDLGLMDANGEPDLIRAGRVQARMDKRAGAVVSKDTAGVRRDSSAALATQLREKAYTAMDKEGRPYAKKAAIDSVLNRLSIEQQANPEQVMAALVMARGLEGAGESPEEPLHVDGGGRVPRVAAALTDMDKQIASLRGKTETDWSKLTKDDPAVTGDWGLE